MNATSDEDGIESHSSRSEHVRLEPVSNRKHLIRVRIAGEMEGVPVDRLERLAVPDDVASHHLIHVSQRSRAHQRLSAMDYHPIRIETVKSNALLRPVLEVTTVSLDGPPPLIQTRDGKVGEIFPYDPDTSSLEYNSIGFGPEEADRMAKRQQPLDPGVAAGRDRIPRIPRQTEPGDMLLNGLCGTGSIRDQEDVAFLLTPLKEPLGRSRIKHMSVVDHAPDVAQDEPVALR